MSASLADVKAEIRAYRKRYEEAKETLYRHPDYIKNALSATEDWGVDQSIIARVTRLKPVSGVGGHRKNRIEWEGYEFTVDGIDYLCRYGSNWCDTLCDVAAVSEYDEDCKHRYITAWEELTSDDRPEVIIASWLLQR